MNHFFRRTNYLTLTSYAARYTGLAQGLAAHTSSSEVLVRIPRKLTAADHSTPITEYDLSLRCLTKQYINFQNAKLEKFHIFLRHTKLP